MFILIDEIINVWHDVYQWWDYEHNVYLSNNTCLQRFPDLQKSKWTALQEDENNFIVNFDCCGK